MTTTTHVAEPVAGRARLGGPRRAAHPMLACCTGFEHCRADEIAARRLVTSGCRRARTFTQGCRR